MGHFKDQTKRNQSPWKNNVTEFYEQFSMSPDVHEDLTKRLMDFNLGKSFSDSSPSSFPIQMNPPRAHILSSFLKLVHKSGVGYAISALAAAALTFGLLNTESDAVLDTLAEIANQPGPRLLPADFDLEGNPEAFGDLMQEVFPKQEFRLTQLPKEATRGYKPSEARMFFTGSGQPGVTIQLLNSSNKTDGGTTLLYIVQLGEGNSKGFPREQKITRNVVSRTGKQKRVNAWRDEKFGYAMVQTVALNEESR